MVSTRRLWNASSTGMGWSHPVPELEEGTKRRGSDDHSGLNIASMHTLGSGPDRAGISGQRRRAGRPASRRRPRPGALARNLYSIAYSPYRTRSGLGQSAAKMVCLQFADRMLGRVDAREDGFCPPAFGLRT